MNIRDMLAWWKLDEIDGVIAADSSGNGYNGTYVNTPTLNQIGAFGSSKAVGFASASSQKVTATPTVSAYPFTIALWAKPTDLAAQTEMMEIKTTLGHIRIEQRVDGSLRIIRYDGTTNNFTLVKSSVFAAGTWSHVALVCASNTSTTAYVNGGSPTSVSVSVNFTGSTGVTLAAHVGGAYFNGTLDDVRIYNRALSAGEIALLYAWTGDEHTDAWTHNKNDGNIPFSVGTLSIPNKSFAVFSNQGNIDLQQINNKFNRSDGQHFYKPPS